MTRSIYSPLLQTLLVICLWMPAAALMAQESSLPEKEEAGDSRNIRELLESERKADAVIRETKAEMGANADLPRTPLQLMVTLREAGVRGERERAASFLDMRYVPDDIRQWPAVDLMDALRVVWTQQNIVDVTQLSDEPEGKLDDGLPAYRDLLGVVTKDNGEQVPVYLQRIPDGNGGKIWKISNATVAEIPALWADLGYGPIAVWLQRNLPDYQLAGMESWQLIAGVIFLVLGWYAATLISLLLMRLALRIPNSFPRGIESFFRGPFRFFVFLAIFRLLMDQLALSLTARVYLNSSGVDYIAFSILALGIISLIRDYNIRRLEHADNRQYVALLKPFTTIVKFVVLLAVALVWAERAGYNMSTIIAGLGVGSLAVALAAQKTLENVIGAITLYTARPVNPGDLCRFGDIVGVVDEIGLRSTMIRTLNRTMLAVPNSVFSSVEVENFSHRDRIRYYQHLELQMSTADQLRVILGRLRELFLSHADVMQETVSIRLEKIASATAVIRIDAGVNTTDYQRYLAVAEDLNLRTIELVHGAGAVFSGPGQVLQLRDFYQASEATLADIQSELQRWKTAEKMPFPDFTEAEKAALKGAIELPIRGENS
jgi:MscS family membrane protein